MGRRQVVVVLLIAVPALAAVLWTVFSRSSRRGKEISQGVLEVEVPESQAGGHANVPAPATDAPGRRLSIDGRVLDVAFKPVAGTVILVGQEQAISDGEGEFSFPAAVRPRRAAVGVRREGASGGEAKGGEILFWEDVLCGDLQAGGGQDVPDEAVSQERVDLPVRLERIRWTITLGSEGGKAASGAAAVVPPEGEWIQIEDAFAEEWGKGARIRLRGKTRLPDEARLAANLYFDRLRTLSSVEEASPRDGAFEAVIYCPEDLKLYSAPYEAQVLFSQALQNPAALEEMYAQRPQIPWDALQETAGTKRIFIGDPEEARQEDLHAQAYYREILREVRGLWRSLKMRCEEIELLGKDWDPAILQTRRAARQGWFHEDFVTPAGEFREERWRSYLDAEWRPRVKDLLERHQARGQEKYPEAGKHLHQALSALHYLSFVYSAFLVYPRFGLKVHPNDFYPDEEELEDRGRLERTLIQSSEELERYAHLRD